MSKQIEALKLALEALKLIDEAMPFPVAKLAQADIREALAEQPGIECDCETATSPDGSRLTKCGSDQMRLAAQEGHAFRKQPAQQEPFGYFRYDLRLDAWVQNRAGTQGTPFYTSPPAQRTWVSLTDDDIEFLRHELVIGRNDIKTIEAKLQEKNNEQRI